MAEKFVVFCVGGQGIREYGDGRGASTGTRRIRPTTAPAAGIK